MTDNSIRRTIVDLVPRYAHARRAGWTPGELDERLSIGLYVLLRRVAMDLDAEPVSIAVLRAHLANPYGVAEYDTDALVQLEAHGWLDQADDTYALAPAGTAILTRGERAANDYAAARYQLPPDDLAQLAAILDDVAERQRLAPEPADKTQQNRVPRLRRFDPRQTPAVRLEYALYALQRARDDAHIAAWRAAGFRGPDLDLLSRLWAGDAATPSVLEFQMGDRMQPDAVAAGLEQLARAGHVTLDGTAVTITDRGRSVRDAIEQETDRVYFAPWPELDATWVRDRLHELATALNDSSVHR